MQVKLLNTEAFIKERKLEEVSNPIFLDKDRVPTAKGLFSQEIFGSPGSNMRKNTFAYIDLGKPFLNPLVFITLKSIQRNIIGCISGEMNFAILKSGELVPDESGKSGLDFLYKNWDKIKFKKSLGTDSPTRVDKIKFIRSLSREEVFMKKLIIIPPFFRDLDWSQLSKGIIVKDEINDIYLNILGKASPKTEGESGIDFVLEKTNFRIQLELVKVYESFKELLHKKKGMLKKNLLGKTIDYSVRLVISVNDYTGPSPVDYQHAGVPLPYVLVLFFPFIMHEVISKFTETLQVNKKIAVIKDGTYETIELHEDAYLDFLEKEIERRIKLFIRDHHSRTDPILIKDKKGKMVPMASFQPFGISVDGTKEAPRSLTWLDLFYIVASDVVVDKHVYISRYPLDSLHNMFPSKVAVLTTNKTVKEVINEREYPFYPSFDPEDKNVHYIDTLRFSSSYLGSTGADFDGDQVSVRSVFTKEANDEADKLIKSPKMMLNASGAPIRTILHEGVQGLYSLTKD